MMITEANKVLVIIAVNKNEQSIVQTEAQTTIREQLRVSAQMQTMVELLNAQVDRMQKTSKASTQSKK
jgi:lipopolysaccharide biosynthesis regulator YciM